MFSGAFSIWHMLVLLIVVMLVFGTKKIRNLGGDLGHAIKNFRGAMKTGEEGDDEEKQRLEQAAQNSTQARTEEKDKA